MTRLLATADMAQPGSEFDVALRVAVDVIQEQDANVTRLTAERDVHMEMIADLQASLTKVVAERDAQEAIAYRLGELLAERTLLLARCSSWLRHYPGTLTEKWILADIERALGGKHDD